MIKGKIIVRLLTYECGISWRQYEALSQKNVIVRKVDNRTFPLDVSCFVDLATFRRKKNQLHVNEMIQLDWPMGSRHRTWSIYTI